MQVFHDEQHWLPCGQCQEEASDAFQRLLSLPLRRQRERRIASRVAAATAAPQRAAPISGKGRSRLAQRVASSLLQFLVRSHHPGVKLQQSRWNSSMSGNRARVLRIRRHTAIPAAHAAPCATCSFSTCTSRDLPMPASPAEQHDLPQPSFRLAPSAPAAASLLPLAPPAASSPWAAATSRRLWAVPSLQDAIHVRRAQPPP